MRIPEWFKPACFGVVAGGGALALVGFGWGGWQTSSAAEQMAADQSKHAVVAALVPVCLDQSRRDGDRVRVMNALNAEPGYKQRKLLMDAGWATVPGTEEPDGALAEACLKALTDGVS